MCSQTELQISSSTKSGYGGRNARLTKPHYAFNTLAAKTYFECIGALRQCTRSAL